MFSVLGGFALLGLWLFVIALPIHNNVVTGANVLACTGADLGVAKTVNNSTPNAGDVITYTITVTNNGPSDATGVQLTDKLPMGVTFGGYTATQGIYTNSLWTIGNLANTTNATLTITATVDSGTCITTIPNVANGLTANQSDPEPDNNAASVTITVTGADLGVAKMVNDATPSVGDLITYTVTVTNYGPEDATGVLLTDVLPAGVAFGGYTATQGVYAHTTGLWMVGEISCSARATLTITATVDGHTGFGTITNTAILTAASLDPNPTNNEASVPIDPTSAGHCLYLPIVLNFPCIIYDFSCPEDDWEEDRGGSDREFGCIDGEFQMLAINSSQTHLAWPRGKYENYTISVTVRWADDSSIGQKYGLTFGIAANGNNISSFYTFMITPTTQNYEIRYYNASHNPRWDTLYLGNSPAISTGLASNYLRVEKLNGKVSIAVNNTPLVGNIDATPISGGRHVGIGVGPYEKLHEGHNADARFDDYQICLLATRGASFDIMSTTGPQGGSVPGG